VSAPTLEPEEIDAIRAAIQQAQPPSTLPTAAAMPEASPIALISDNRNAERARPNALRVISRWVRTVERHLAVTTGLKLSLQVASVESIDGATARAQTQGAWLSAVSSGEELGMIAISGPIVETVVARMLGDNTPAAPTTRPLSALSRRLFSMTGQGIVASLVDVWREELGATITTAPAAAADPWRMALDDGETVLVATLSSASPAGMIRIVARPELLAGPDVASEAAPAPARVVEAALANVPIAIRVELGTARMTMAELAALDVGVIVPLDRLIDDSLPVLCAGVLKAHGKPLTSRGAIAVEITALEPSVEKLP
jgi:flagellar motor switch/type III secretory pathway protein FliN